MSHTYNRILGSKYDPIYINENDDSFGRIRQSQPYNIFDHKQIYDNGVPSHFVHYTSGTDATITYDQANAKSTLNCGTASFGRALRQTKRYFNYQPGKGMLITTTFNFSGAQTNCEKRVGYYDDSNGVFLSLSSSGVGFMNLRTASSSSIGSLSISQSAWNVDKFDGAGPSEKRLDFTKAQIFGIDFQWLGVGQVRTGFFIDQDFYPAHEFYHANITNNVYMSTPNLPVRWEILASGGVPAANPKMDAICTSVISEGGHEPRGVVRGFATTAVNSITAGGIAPIISIRLSGTQNRRTAYPVSVTTAPTTNNSRGIVYLYKNATLTSPSWISQSNSTVEVDTAATMLTGGYIISAGVIGTTGEQVSLFFENEPATVLASDFTGTSDTLTVAIRSIAADSWLGSINWKEIL